MVFIIQHTQVRDTEAMHLKLDELILAIADARNEYRGLELRSEEEIHEMRAIDNSGGMP
jgi:low affinity Fe/Cu permease